MQHYTKNQKVENQRIEEFSELLHEHLNLFPVAPAEAKILWNSLKTSLRGTKFPAAIFLNWRYVFSKSSAYSGVPQEVQALIAFLDSEEIENLLDCNALYIALEILWRDEE